MNKYDKALKMCLYIYVHFAEGGCLEIIKKVN